MQNTLLFFLGFAFLAFKTELTYVEKPQLPAMITGEFNTIQTVKVSHDQRIKDAKTKVSWNQVDVCILPDGDFWPDCDEIIVIKTDPQSLSIELESERYNYQFDIIKKHGERYLNSVKRRELRTGEITNYLNQVKL